MTKISVLTPSFNSGIYIENAIQSVLSQNFDDFEHIIVDGGSTDNTIEIFKKYPHLKWISEKDKGQSDAMNKAFALSSGEIITYLNADDYYEEGVFDFVSTYFDQHPDCEMLVGIVQMHMKVNNRIINTSANHSLKKLRLHFMYDFPYNPVGYYYRKAVQVRIGPFPIKNHFSMDYWFLLKAYKLFDVHHVSRVFGHYIMTGENKTSNVDTFNECKKTYIRFALKEDFRGLFQYFYYLYKIRLFKGLKFLMNK